jgi:hypothetical protein
VALRLSPALRSRLRILEADRDGQGDDGNPAVGRSAPSQEELLAAVALDIQALAQHRQNPLESFKPRSGQQVLEELRGVNELAGAKASLQEAEAFRRWLLAAAQSAADAGKEGGFPGFGAEQVNVGERRMLDQVRGVLGMV